MAQQAVRTDQRRDQLGFGQTLDAQMAEAGRSRKATQPDPTVVGAAKGLRFIEDHRAGTGDAHAHVRIDHLDRQREGIAGSGRSLQQIAGVQGQRPGSTEIGGGKRQIFRPG